MNYIQHTIPHHSWSRFWNWNLTEDQKLYIAHREQEMKEEEQRVKTIIDESSKGETK